LTNERVATLIGVNADFPPASSAFRQRIANAPIVARKRQCVLDLHAKSIADITPHRRARNAELRSGSQTP
jgi:hypothetical protein